MARDLRYRDYSLMPEQRRQRSAAGYLEAHNGEWFSCYDLNIEKNQCWTVVSDILLTFGYAYGRYLDKSPYCMRIFVERCTNSDISEIKNLTRTSLRHKKYECNFYEVDLNNVRTEAEFTRLRDEIASSEIPAVVFIDADNFTYDKFVTGQLDEGEIGKIIDDLTEQLLPQSGLLIYMERYPQYDADDYGNVDPYAYDDPDRNAEPEEYPEGYGTMEIDFDNVNESKRGRRK